VRQFTLELKKSPRRHKKDRGKLVFWKILLLGSSSSGEVSGHWAHGSAQDSKCSRCGACVDGPFGAWGGEIHEIAMVELYFVVMGNFERVPHFARSGCQCLEVMKRHPPDTRVVDAIFRLIEARSNEMRSQPTRWQPEWQELGLVAPKLAALP
jgi:hypothetical protein